MVDSPVNIRALKRAAIDAVECPQLPEKCEPTGKRIAVVGGGPSGLTAAYYLALMGHEVTVFEQFSKLGGMLRYGIPRYRLPAKNLDYDIDAILSLGIEVKYNTTVGTDVSYKELEETFDSLYIAIGAHQGKSPGIEGENDDRVISAVEFLHSVEDGNPIDLAGKDVVVIGGGNVAMDATRTARRLGANNVTCVYRRRKDDMTALPQEVEAAVAEGCELATLKAPLRVEAREDGLRLIVQGQMAGTYSWGRPKPVGLGGTEEAIPCDIIISAIGQAVEFESFESAGLQVKNGKFMYEANAVGAGCSKTFVGGDCATGPATVIKAIEAGRIAAANIDELLGFNHVVWQDIDVPVAQFRDIVQTGRANNAERPAEIRIKDFADVEEPLKPEEICQEAGRCLRCDHFGLGAFRVGRSPKW
ncbi:MAG: FAD-dependent oxidoreductase, partial [Coriobacteriaceae bacterium]|nr:FAD-dependent oxidoreductase [Coriobacteriaceae bacterium]